MSFTYEVKNEVSKLEVPKTENIAELSALLISTAEISDTIKITIENASVARKIFSSIKEIFDINVKITVRKGFNFQKKYLYILEITKKIPDILETLGIANGITSSYIYDDDETLRAYLRGIFLGCGSINDPKKSRYHLEFLLNNITLANELNKLLNKKNLGSKVLKRENRYMVYIKGSEKISDFLRIISASNALLYYEDIRIYRDHKNMTNRLNNCEQANVDKMIESAQKDIKIIEKLKEKDMFDLLDEKDRLIADYRLKYPESSLQELSEIISLETPAKLTKSGIYHRLRKIKELGKKIENQ
ncbi:putative sporulation transcription regulator WhiA [Firmicutes bacterium CAG:884]|nr:putative sporulation transcription regulator WhiA [Firmicutes bacterium CAG:884]